MSDNPYQAPAPVEPVDRRTVVEKRGEQSFNSLWDTFFWSFAGFAGGTFVVDVVLKAIGIEHEISGGVVLGGVPLAFAGFFAAERRRRARTITPRADSTVPAEDPTRD